MADRTLQGGIKNPQNDYEREIAQLSPWFHNLHLPDGTQTAPDHPLGDFPSFKWRRISPLLPQDLTGWQVLDIGCNAGFYSFQLARRGAEVTAIDINPHYLRQAQWAGEQFGVLDRIHFRQMQVYDLAREEQSYDLILFMGVLYHLRYPLLALDIICRKVRRLLCLQALTFPGPEAQTAEDIKIEQRDLMLLPQWPKMAFIEKKLEDDPTNWWVPNDACIMAMLRSCGMSIVNRPGDEIYLCEPNERIGEDQDSLEDEYLSATGQ